MATETEYTIKFDVKVKYVKNIYSKDFKKQFKEGDNVLKLSYTKLGFSGAENGGISRTKNKISSPFFYNPSTMEQIENRPGSNGRYFDGYAREKNTGNTGTISNEGWARSGNSVLHEVLHLFGLSDRGTSSDGKFIDGTRDNFDLSDIMAGGTQINQLHYNHWGAYILSQGSPKFTLNKFVDVNPIDGNTPKGTAIK